MKSDRCWLLIAVFVFTGCAVMMSYTAPDTSSVSTQDYSRVINKPFDQTWSALMQYTGSAYFEIQQFEKQSGLLVLSVLGSTPGDYVTGGHCKVSQARKFDGDYVDYCVAYNSVNLQNKINVVVVPIDSVRTRVTVRVHYVFSYGNDESGYRIWTFDSGNSDSHTVNDAEIGDGKPRTVMPTYKIERDILDAVERKAI